MAIQPTAAPKATLLTWLGLTPRAIVRAVWRQRKLLLAVIVLTACLGVLIALLMPLEFVSEARIMPEMGNGSGDMFKRLASMTGFSSIDTGDSDGVDAIRPDLYPNVLQSTPFILYLIDQPVSVETGEQQTVGKLLLPNEGPGWSLKKWLSSGSGKKTRRKMAGRLNGPVQLTARQQELAEEIGKRVGARLDTRSGIITITARMPDAHAAATVAQLAMDYLTQYVTGYRTEKARLDLRFYTQRLNEARRRYQNAQLAVFQYNDQHKYLVVQAATMDRQRMEAELTIAQTVYAELSRQFEQARLKVQERTPVFKVLEPPQIPLRRVSPKRYLIVLLSAAVGMLLGVTYLIGQEADFLSRLRLLTQDDRNDGLSVSTNL